MKLSQSNEKWKAELAKQKVCIPHIPEKYLCNPVFFSFQVYHSFQSTLFFSLLSKVRFFNQEITYPTPEMSICGSQ